MSNEEKLAISIDQIIPCLPYPISFEEYEEFAEEIKKIAEPIEATRTEPTDDAPRTGRSADEADLLVKLLHRDRELAVRGHDCVEAGDNGGAEEASIRIDELDKVIQLLTVA